MNPLYVGIDVSSKNNVAHLMTPHGSKHSSFSVKNNLGGAKLPSERIVSALNAMQLNDAVIGMDATSVYADSLVYALRQDDSLGRYQRSSMCSIPSRSRNLRTLTPTCPRMPL